MASIGLPGRMLAFIVLLIAWALGLFFATIAFAEPAPICVPGDKLQFATVPEIVFVRGMPQTIQLGIYQIDPANPWPAGDLTRSSGWKSRFLTALVHADTAESVDQFAYDAQTGELAYSGAWSGDVDVALVSGAGGALSKATFRIRVLTPSVVFGNNAEATNAEEGWNARTCQGISFANCRKKFQGGASDTAPLVVYITPGTYSGDFYLGERRFVYVLGDPATRPTLVRDSLDTSLAERFYVANLEQQDGSIKLAHAAPQYPSTMIVRNVRQCCETQQQNGVSNPNGLTEQPWTVYIHDFEGQGMGGTGNTTHQFYIEGRPDSTFDVNTVRILGTRRSSAIKTTMQHLNVRHSLLDVRVPGVPDENSAIPIDVPAFTDAVIYGNAFLLTRQPNVPLPAAIFFRLRMPSLGSDIPAYPNVSWNPPISNQATASSPGKGWAKGPETFVDDAFWQDVTSQPLDDPSNVLLFRHYVSFNTFRQLPGSAAVFVLRDDGTHPAEATDQFGPMRAKRTAARWVERSTTFLFGNTYDGQAAGQRLYNLTDSAFVKEIEPGAKWPRSKPEEFPRVVDVTGELPVWFKL